MEESWSMFEAVSMVAGTILHREVIAA